MDNTNDVGAALSAQEDQLESDFKKLGDAVTSEVKNATDEIKALLAQSVVNPAVVEAVTARMAALSSSVQGLTTTVVAADPGPPAVAPV